MYHVRTMYGVQDTDGVHVHIRYWIGWKDKHGAWYTKLSTPTSTAGNKSSLGLRGQALLSFNLHDE